MAKKVTKKNKTVRGAIAHHIEKQGPDHSVIRRFVPRDIITIPWGKPITETEIVRALTRGYEVRIGSVKSGIRIFPFLNQDYKTQRIVAQTHGYFRDAIKDEPWEEAGKVKHDFDELDDIREKRNETYRTGLRLACITPDKTITVECEACGHQNTVRIGKYLADMKK